MNALLIRLIDYSVRVMTITDDFSKDRSLFKISDQLSRSASSIGANYAEAQSASSKKDFHNKIRVALKEARESEYWLELLKRRSEQLQTIEPVLSETVEIIRILTAISNKTKP